MLLNSSRVSAFRNAADLKSDLDGNPLTVDTNGNNVEGESASVSPGEIISPATYNYRSHRTDTFSFFSRQHLQRQTGGTVANTSAPLMSQMSGNEAWIWYGHLILPDNTGTFLYGSTQQVILPGSGTIASGSGTYNPNNFYATQWTLGREAVILQQKDSTGNIVDTGNNRNVQQAYINTVVNVSHDQYNLTPLTFFSEQYPTTAKKTYLYYSRYDLAATSVDDFRSRINTYFNGTPTVSWASAGVPSSTTYNWWGEMICGGPSPRFYGNPLVVSQSGNPQQSGLNRSTRRSSFRVARNSWWNMRVILWPRILQRAR